jgi:hypothetical protein
MPRQQNSRKSEQIADFGWQCALRSLQLPVALVLHFFLQDGLAPWD